MNLKTGKGQMKISAQANLVENDRQSLIAEVLAHAMVEFEHILMCCEVEITVV